MGILADEIESYLKKMLALSAGGMLWGVFGMLCALPALVAVRGALRVFRCTGESEERGKQYEMGLKKN